MSDLRVRKIDFRFEDDIPFQWNPGNPAWGNMVNFATFIAPGFERYFIKATREVMPRIEDPKLRETADLFCKQEAQHSKQHLAHLKVLTQKYPGLQEVYDAVIKSYDDLYENESIEFALAYTAVIELCLAPLARFIVENRDDLFQQADPRIASFVLWHFIEEFEHRHAAIDIYNAVVGSYWYRLKTVRSVLKHFEEIDRIVSEGFKKHIPESDFAFNPTETNSCLNTAPLRKRLFLLFQWFCTTLPYHNPDNVKQPEWVTEWHRAETRGEDMTTYYPLKVS